MQNDAKRRKSKINNKINLVIILLVIILVILAYWSYKIFELQSEKNDINKGYAEEDIETINEVREFFLFYFQAEEYDVDIFDIQFSNCKFIVDDAIELLRKYGELQLDEDKKLTYGKENRTIQIVQDAFVLDTEFNVDILSNNWHNIFTTEVATEYGTWVYVESGDPEYILFLFGNVMDTIEIKDVSLRLRMVDISGINSDKSPYKVDTKYYLFRNYKYQKDYHDYYVYAVNENEWIKFPSIKEIKVEDEYISFINTDNIFYMYCIEHNSKISVYWLEEEETLSWIYDPVYVYLPDSINEDIDLKNELFVLHEQCDY